MRSTVLREGKFVVTSVPDPVPAQGQVVCRVLACGICGSDLHFVKQHREDAERASAAAGSNVDGSGGDVFMGHEFSAEVVEAGPDTVAPPPGTIVTSVPSLITTAGVQSLGFGSEYHAGFSEYLLLSQRFLVNVPNGLPPEHAAMAEPMAVGAHAVARSGITAREAAVVLGCGPVGLAVIAGLALIGVETIIATDFSSARRALATTMGATEVVDPRQEPGIDAWRRLEGQKPLVMFEAVGVPGMLASAIGDCPRKARITVVGVCMEKDEILPAIAISKELDIAFALAYTREEFSRTLGDIAEGRIEVAPLITGRVGLGDVNSAFEALGHPDEQCKILVQPSLG
jgi:threonine dehydrogenase-like Zn-dependent dehydrogenase